MFNIISKKVAQAAQAIFLLHNEITRLPLGGKPANLAGDRCLQQTVFHLQTLPIYVTATVNLQSLEKLNNNNNYDKIK